MAKEYERDANYVLTKKGRADRNADRARATNEARARADAAREAAPNVAGQGSENYLEAPALGVTIREPDPVYDAADAAIAGYATQREWIEAGRP
jgi:hypothetical protein